MAADVDLNINIDKKGKGDEEAALGLEALAKSADNAKDQLAQLDRKLLETRAAMVGAGKTFQETGDISPLKALLKDERQLSQVQKSISRGAEAIAADLTRAGEQGGQNFIARFGNRLSAGIPALGGGLGEGLLYGAVAAAPFIGATVDAAILAGLGGATLAGGIAIAVHDARVQAAFGELGTEAKAGLTDAASSLVDPLVRAAQTFRREFTADVAPGLKQDFAALVPALDHLSAGLAGMAHGIMPGFNEAIKASVPVLSQLGDDLPRIGQSFGFMFDQIAKGGPGAKDSIHDIATTLVLTADAIGPVVRGLSDLYELTHKLPIGGLIQALSAVTDAADKGGAKWHSAADAQKAAADASDKAKKAFQDQQVAADALTRSLDQVTQRELGLQGSQLAIEKGLMDVTATLKQNRGALDEHTKAGLEDRQALLGQVTTIEDWRSKMLLAGKAPSYVAGEVEKMIAPLEANALAAGGNATEVHKLFDQWRAMLDLPPEKTITTNVVTNQINNIITRHIDQGNPVGGGPNRIMAHGGVVAAARGMIASSPTVLFGERGTGLEAYIPKLGISDQRGLALADQAASWHGGRVVADRGGYGGVGMGVGGGGSTIININVDAAMGVNEYDLAYKIGEAVRKFVSIAGGGNAQSALGQRGH